MTKAASAHSTTPPGAHPDESIIFGWAAERHRFADAAERTSDEDEVARLSDQSDVFDDLIRAVACVSVPVAILKLRIIKDDLDRGQRWTARPSNAVLDQVVAFLDQVVAFLEAL